MLLRNGDNRRQEKSLVRYEIDANAQVTQVPSLVHPLLRHLRERYRELIGQPGGPRGTTTSMLLESSPRRGR